MSDLSDESQILIIWCGRQSHLLPLPDDFCQHYEMEACEMLNLLDQIWLQNPIYTNALMWLFHNPVN